MAESETAEKEIDLPGALLCQRWYVLFVASLAGFNQGWIWNTYGPIAIATKQTNTFDWNDSIIAWLGNWGPIAYVIAFAPTAWALDVLKLRPTSIVGAVLVFAASAIRLVDTSRSRVCLILQHVGQCLNGLAGPFAMSAGTVISATWFAPSERTTSTAIYSISNMLGVSVSYLIGPLVVSSHGSTQDIRTYLWIQFAFSAAALVLVLLYLPSRPPNGKEPSVTACQNRRSFRQGLEILASHGDFWRCAMAYGVMTGLYAGWGPLYALIMEKLGPSVAPHPQRTAMWAGFFSNFLGNVAGMIFGVVIDRGLGRQQMKRLIVAFSLFGVGIYAVFSWLMMADRLTLPVVYVLCILGGVAINGTVPIFYELAVDCTYPVGEGLTTTVLTVVNNIAGLFFLLLPSLGIGIGSWVNVSVAVGCALSACCLCLFRGRLNRTAEDEDGGAGRWRVLAKASD
eukprot:g5203.t1